jgi:hypothetical protein
VFDGDGNYKTRFLNVGTPRAICITSGPRQVMYVSNSNVPEDIDVEGNIYKVDLTGKLLGTFGRAGRIAKEFNAVNQLECRRENECGPPSSATGACRRSRSAARRARINQSGPAPTSRPLPMPVASAFRRT